MYPCLYLSKHDKSKKDKAWAEIGMKYNATSKFYLFDILVQIEVIKLLLLLLLNNSKYNL